MKWKPGSPCSNAMYEFLAAQFVLHYLGWKIEVVGWRNPKMQENARVGGSTCRSQRVGQKGKSLNESSKRLCNNTLDMLLSKWSIVTRRSIKSVFQKCANAQKEWMRWEAFCKAVQCNGIRTGHISPTVMSITPLPLSCLVTWHVELFCGSLQWGGVWMMLLFLAFLFVAVIGGSLIGFNGFHFFL